MIGMLGMLLPWIVVALQLLNPIFIWPASISATWYTNACTPFMIILGSASLLLISYKGYSPLDDGILTLAGIAGLFICLYPCGASGVALVGTFLTPVNFSAKIHNISAIVFFGLLSFNSMFLFTKSNGEMTKKKKIRNIIYIICGIGMISSFAILLLPSFSIRIWLMETIALFFFGVSFLTKADVFPFLFCDTPYIEAETDD